MDLGLVLLEFALFFKKKKNKQMAASQGSSSSSFFNIVRTGNTGNTGFRGVSFPGLWTRADAETRPDCLFVFEDNDAGIGERGQAVLRGLPNAVGVPTRKHPSDDDDEWAFYNDAELALNCIKISAAVDRVLKLARSGRFKTVYLQQRDDIFMDTGLAALPTRAPQTYTQLHVELGRLFAQSTS
jgi:hypothetical protein